MQMNMTIWTILMRMRLLFDILLLNTTIHRGDGLELAARYVLEQAR